VRRREFITLLGGAAAAWPLAARAQQSAPIARIGFLGSALDAPLFVLGYPAFLAELRKLGFTEGQNLIIEHRRVDEGASKAFAAAAEVIRSKVDVMVAFGPEIALKAAVAASQTIPIVMIAVNFDPIAGGYVSDIAQPNRNITGLVYQAPELAAKQLELLLEAFPERQPIAVLWEQASAEQFDSAQRAAQSLHVHLRSHMIRHSISMGHFMPSSRMLREWCLSCQARRTSARNAPISPTSPCSIAFQRCSPSGSLWRRAG
jgi:putative ABC transport system substrate-binding protein